MITPPNDELEQPAFVAGYARCLCDMFTFANAHLLANGDVPTGDQMADHLSHLLRELENLRGLTPSIASMVSMAHGYGVKQ